MYTGKDDSERDMMVTKQVEQQQVEWKVQECVESENRYEVEKMRYGRERERLLKVQKGLIIVKQGEVE